MLKKSMDIVDVYSWTRRHRTDLAGCFIDNIYRSKYYWLLKLRCRGSLLFLKVEPGVRIHLSSSEPSIKEIDNFTRYLRANVRDGRILSIDQQWWERIITIQTETRGKLHVHHVELLPRGLWVIVNQESKILYSSRFQEFKDRVVKIGVEYKPPPLKGLPPWNQDELFNALKRGKDLVRGLVYEWGLPGYIAEEIIYRSGLINSKNLKPLDIPSQDCMRLVDEYLKLIHEAESGLGYLVIGDTRPELYTAYKPLLFQEHLEKEIMEAGSIDEAMDRYFMELESVYEEEERKKRLKAEMESWKRRIDEQLKTISEYEAKLSDLSKKLELIYLDYSRLERIVDCARETIRIRGWDNITTCEVESFDKSRGVIHVNVNGMIIELSIREPLRNQVIALEAERGELKKKIEKAKSILVELEEGLRRVQGELTARVYAKPSPMFWYEKYRWSITRGGFLVVAGRDASQNEAIVKKYLGDGDIFLHADIHGAPATIVITGNRSPSVDDLVDAAVIAASYSKAWKEGLGFIDVFWVKGSQVSKTPPSGMYIGRGSFMIYGERNYVKVRLELGVGLRVFCDSIYGEYVKVFVGSPDVVRDTCISYVILAPGDLEREDAVEEIKRILIENARLKTGVVYRVPDDSIRNILPGPIRIIEKGIGRGLVNCVD